MGIPTTREKEKKMSAGFGGEKLKDGKAVVIINDNYVSQLIKEAEDNPLD